MLPSWYQSNINLPTHICSFFIGGSADIVHLLPFQYVALGAGRETRHRKQTGTCKIIKNAKGYTNTPSFSMSLWAQAIDSPSTFLRYALSLVAQPGALSSSKRRIVHAYGATSKTGMLVSIYIYIYMSGVVRMSEVGGVPMSKVRSVCMSEVGSVRVPNGVLDVWFTRP